jgi:hypothetical protein
MEGAQVIYVFELVKPGVWLEGIDDEAVKRDVESLVRLLESTLTDAATSLNMFEESRGMLPQSFDRAEWDADRNAEAEIARRYEAELPPDLPLPARFAAVDALRDRAKVEVRRARWTSGRLPESYTRRMPFIHAKSCLYALDTMGKALKQLARLPSAPAEVMQSYADFGTAFPTLVDVRDSAHHAEDRVQGKRYKARINLQPVANSVVHAPAGGVLIGDMLNGNSYGSTLGDGTYGEVEISPSTVAYARDIVQRVLDAYVWHGPKEHSPS